MVLLCGWLAEELDLKRYDLEVEKGRYVGWIEALFLND